MNLRDTAERLWWTLVAAFLGALGVSDVLDISALDAALAATAAAGVNFLLLVARARLAVLPEPGEGLPGLPTGDAGAGELDTVVKVLVIVLLVVVILALV
jgi:hypothetical protein